MTFDYSKLYDSDDYLDRIEGLVDYEKRKISYIKQIEIDLLNINPSDCFLDIGCGRGEVLRHVLKTTDKISGIDISKKSVENTIKICGGKGNIQQASATDIPFSDESFDKILIVDVIEHLTPEDSKKMILECKRLIREGGRILIHTAPNKNFMDSIFYPGRKILKIFGIIIDSLEEKVANEKKYHINTYTPQRLFNEIVSCNLNCKILYPIGLFRGGNHYLLSSLLIRVLSKIVDPISKLPVVRNLLVNDLFALIKHK